MVESVKELLMSYNSGESPGGVGATPVNLG